MPKKTPLRRKTRKGDPRFRSVTAYVPIELAIRLAKYCAGERLLGDVVAEAIEARLTGFYTVDPVARANGRDPRGLKAVLAIGPGPDVPAGEGREPAA